MLVVRPPRIELGRVAVKVALAGAFEVIVVDFDAVPGAVAQVGPEERQEKRALRKGGWAPELLVRKLALAAESSAATVLLLTDSMRPRATAWPVALRLDLTRPKKHELAIRVAKDRRARIGMAKTLPFRPLLVPMFRAG
jgi:hypothetical protein